RMVLTAPPRWPDASFFPAATSRPPCWTAEHAFPTRPLISPPTVQTGLSGLKASARGAAAPVAQAPPTRIATARRLGCTAITGRRRSTGGAPEPLEEVHEPGAGTDDQRGGARDQRRHPASRRVVVVVRVGGDRPQ